jgi:RpiR family transcriptional regulator, carbohydrate utilization regulator
VTDVSDRGTGANQAASSSYPLALIRSQLAALSPSEARVATTILERPYDAMYWSAADLGANSSTSAATAVRTCRKLGFDGLQELRLELARDLKWGNDDHEGKPAAPVAVLAEMVAMATKTMEGIVTSVNAQSFDRIVTVVRRARRVLLVATGDTHALCSDLAFRLTSAGRPAEFSPDAISQHISAALLGPKDVCIAISNSGSNGLTLRAVEGARSAGATVIAVTASPKSRLVAIADHSLIVGGFDASLGMQTAVNSVAFLLTLRALTMAVGSRLSRKDAVAVQNVLDTIAGYHYR